MVPHSPQHSDKAMRLELYGRVSGAAAKARGAGTGRKKRTSGRHETPTASESGWCLVSRRVAETKQGQAGRLTGDDSMRDWASSCLCLPEAFNALVRPCFGVNDGGHQPAGRMTTMMMMTIWRDFLSLPRPSLLLRLCVFASFRRLVRSYPPPPRARTHTL